MMDIFQAQGIILLALGITVAFGLGWLAHRRLNLHRQEQHINELTDQLAFLERQRDSAHRMSLELADTHDKLVGEHLEAEWKIHSLKSDLEVRDARIKKLLVTANSDRRVVKTDIWNMEETHLR